MKTVNDELTSDRHNAQAAWPLVVDLDGTLTPSDTLVECIVGAVKGNPSRAPALLAALLRGRAALKAEASRLYPLPVEHLPLREDFVAFLREEHASGRRMVLATAADRSIAERMQERLGLFSDVIASEGQLNLKGQAKLQAIQQLLGNDFVYAGDSPADIAIWRASRGAVLVGATPKVARRARATTPIEREFPHQAPLWPTLLRAMRVHQWLKNLLIFVPLLTAYSVVSANRMLDALLGFLAFSLVASATYMVNDLWDLESDRAHERKRRRPFASGDLDIRLGCMLLPLMLLGGLGLAALVSLPFLAWTFTYLVMTSAYSWTLKTYVVLDVLTLAVLYTLRIIAGAVAINVQVSSWLLAFSVFLFFSLALVKRCSELVALRARQRAATTGRDYRVDDLAVLWPMGVGASLGAILVFGLYISAPETQLHYRSPGLLWLVALALIYWTARLWVKTSRGEMHDDPVVYAVSNQGSRLTVLFVLVCALIARFADLGGVLG